MYIGYETKCAGTPSIVIFVAAITAAKLVEVMLPSWVVMAVS
jgi:hypothetical protein